MRILLRLKILSKHLHHLLDPNNMHQDLLRQRFFDIFSVIFVTRTDHELLFVEDATTGAIMSLINIPRD